MTVVPATKMDIEGVLEVERSSFASPWSEKMFVSDLSEPFARFLVGKDESGAVIGFAIFWMVSGELHLLNLAILPSMRRQGYARMFLNHMLDEGAKADCELAFLEVRPSNDAARRLYESMGFEDFYIRRGYYTDNNENALVMMRRLCRKSEGT